ncbi:MAG: precorrin-3B synthase [Ancalomicrobiaceae bacterium]|nr:precorrin-3B synthase [Ancalomicrobiaceae bacterium]
MSEPVPSVKGWCPGALRPMRSGDGLVVRLQLTAGVLSAPLARRIAALSERYGNGQIDLTQRANLQLRGVSDDTWPELIGELAALGLIETDAEVEAVKNIVASPLAGPGWATTVDCHASVAALGAAIGTDPVFRRLPGKFGFVIDDGGYWPLDDVAADVWFVGRDGRFDIEVPQAGGFVRLGTVAPDAIGAAAAAVAQAFLDLRGDGEGGARRMRDLAARIGAAAIADHAGFSAAGHSERPARQARRSIGAGGPLGAGAYLGLGVVFGRLTAVSLDWLADLAKTAASGELRLTPWRSILVPGVDLEISERLLAGAVAAGFIVSPEDPRLVVVACPGAPECESAAGPVREDALALAEVAAKMVGRGVRLHVSACPKGCARTQPAAATLIRRHAGYDLVVNGRADDDPVSTGLQPQDIEGALRRLKAIEGQSIG